MTEETHEETPERLIGLPVFKPGDVVHLKSGSPKMTVTAIRGNDEAVEVIWSPYGSDQIQRMLIPTVALRAATR